MKGSLQRKYDSSIKTKQNKNREEHSTETDPGVDFKKAEWHIATLLMGGQHRMALQLPHHAASGPQTPLHLLPLRSLNSKSARTAGQITAPAHTSALRTGSGISAVCCVDAPKCTQISTLQY